MNNIFFQPRPDIYFTRVAIETLCEKFDPKIRSYHRELNPGTLEYKAVTLWPIHHGITHPFCFHQHLFCSNPDENVDFFEARQLKQSSSQRVGYMQLKYKRTDNLKYFKPYLDFNRRHHERRASALPLC